MERHELEELHYITSVANVPSIFQLGILSNRRAAKVDHVSVAAQAVQERRAKVKVPKGRRLHEYVNLYVCARNPMMYLRKDKHAELCVLRVNTAVLDREGVVITDANAASDYTRFAPAPDGLKIVDRALTFAEYWTDPDPIEQWRKKSAKCAEVLVPDRVDPALIDGVYVSCSESSERFGELGIRCEVSINPHWFFR